jgi:hypothetical protein
MSLGSSSLIAILCATKKIIKTTSIEQLLNRYSSMATKNLAKHQKQDFTKTHPSQ